jgi:serine phosphatase RsbU (regulator of sigma subunit)
LERDDRASVAEIAAAAGVARSTLYRHFQTREELTAALEARKAERNRGEHEQTREDDARLAHGDSGSGFVLAAPPGASDLEDAHLAPVNPPGRVGPESPVVVDATHVLNEVPPYLVGDQLVVEAQRVAGVPVALYAVDVDGSYLRRLAGSDEFPSYLEGPLSVGPEIAPDALPELYARLEAVLPDSHPYPMWLRGRAIGVLLAARRPRNSLAGIARQGTAALELANMYTDALEVARRRRRTTAAAEIQLNLLPPRNAMVAGGELAGSLLPGYEVAGDWFDHAENPDGTWLATAETSGQGVSAAASASVALGALRAARRTGGSLEQAVEEMDAAVRDLKVPGFEVATVVARWHATTSTFVWISCGDAAPLRWSPEGRCERLGGRGYGALGHSRKSRSFRPRERRLSANDRIVLYTGGVPGRVTSSGERLGLEGVVRAVRAMGDRSAAATVRSIQEAVTRASSQPLEDDAAVVVLAVH